MLSRQIRRVMLGFGHAKNNSLSLLVKSEKVGYLEQLEENAVMNYKIYPALPHQDPISTEYIESDLDEYKDTCVTVAYNTIIDNFKNDLKVQREVWEAIANLDRPYKRGVPGVDTNLDPNGPHKQVLPDLGFQRRDINNETMWTFANEDRFIANTPWHKKIPFQHIIEWEKERQNRPVTRDYNHGKGYKYDVPVAPEEKYNYVADRLGHPEFFGTPMDRLFKLEKDIFHPTFIDQPFVKMPTQYPSDSLNFEQGEVIYENTRVLEWVRAIQLGNIAFLAYAGVFIPLNMIFKTNMITNKADELWIGQTILWNPYCMDALRLFTPISSLGVFYIIYSTMRVITQVTGQYAFKVSYSKDKVLSSSLRSSSSSNVSTTMALSKKTSTKPHISKFFPPVRDLVSRT